MRIKRRDVIINIPERFSNYSLVQVLSLPALIILTAKMCSSVQLVVNLSVVEFRTLLGPRQFCRDIPRIISAQEEANHRRCNLAIRYCYFGGKTRLA